MIKINNITKNILFVSGLLIFIFVLFLFLDRFSIDVDYYNDTVITETFTGSSQVMTKYIDGKEVEIKVFERKTKIKSMTQEEFFQRLDNINLILDKTDVINIKGKFGGAGVPGRIYNFTPGGKVNVSNYNGIFFN